jgi:hypothetical protein
MSFTQEKNQNIQILHYSQKYWSHPMLMVFQKEKPCSELLKASNNRIKVCKANQSCRVQAGKIKI